ncbi:hypothetical protein C1H46_041056 [Malus baccata]|uniref:Tf2-1-like SH3-like domain-containing protein n=1 Tax=Malus baccata TaxID=106549 RepID=A0A540KGT5_MALBA|nr:hypothetical protein C1H46_041056 [Malus baccata]
MRYFLPLVICSLYLFLLRFGFIYQWISLLDFLHTRAKLLFGWLWIDYPKYAHFLALSHPFTASMIAQLFVDNIFKLHGMPNSIVNDRDPIFLSKFWKEFFALQGSTLCYSSGHHPQTEGQYDKKRKEGTFEVGDWVYLRLVLYQYMSLGSHSFHKLQPQFYGPFEVLAKVGLVAYKLKLTETSKLHPVFHVSCLNKHLGIQIQPTMPLPVITDSGVLQEVPVAILDRRLVKKGHAAAT